MDEHIYRLVDTTLHLKSLINYLEFHLQMKPSATEVGSSLPSRSVDSLSADTSQLPPPVSLRRENPGFRTPEDLARTDHPVERALVIGSCFSQIMSLYLPHGFAGLQVDHVLFNHAAVLPALLSHPLETYDFQVIMMPLRSAIPEQLYLRLAYNDIAGHAAAFQTACESVQQMLAGALAYRDKRQITTFVTNFAVPQQNLMGRLMPRYDLRNPVYFIEKLNQAIAEEIESLVDVHYVDIDQISANFGRKYIQDDILHLSNHGSVFSDYELGMDTNRLEPPTSLVTEHDFHTAEFLTAIAKEIRAMHRTLRQTDQVKLVIVDLDDTVWRGVVADEGIERPDLVEGWPVAFVESLAYLKKRGIMLAIVSKNDEARIRELWPYIYGSRLELEDFAAIRINWNSKAQNVADILAEVNLLPQSVVFIDDNPVERANVKAVFPDIRVLGASPYQLRRIMLWSAETQVAKVSDESGRRTNMIQAQVQREDSRKRLSREEFLQTLDVQMRLFAIKSVEDPKFLRAFELINKTNQFNTTGYRWTQDACHQMFAAGHTFWAFEVGDRFTHYGLVGVLIVRDDLIEQTVMSCRVMGLEVELTAVIAVLKTLSPAAGAKVIATESNLPCRDLYARCGLVEEGDLWHVLADHIFPSQDHIRLAL